MARGAVGPRHPGVQLRLLGCAGLSLRAARARRDVLRPGRARRRAGPRAPALRDAQHRRDGLQRAHDRSAVQAHPVLPDVAARGRRRLRPVLRHAGRLQLRHGPRAGQLPRPVPLLRRAARRSRLLLHRLARHAARCRAPLHVADRPARLDAQMGPRLFGLDHDLHRCAECAGAHGRVHRALPRARHPVRFVPPVVGLHVDRAQALRLQLEPRQVPGRARLCRRLSRARHPPVRQHQAVPAARSPRICRGRQGRPAGARCPWRARVGAVLGRGGRLSRFHQPRHRGLVEGAREARLARLRHRRHLERQQ